MLASMCVKAERTKRSGRLANVDILIFLFILLFSYSIFDAIYERVIYAIFFLHLVGSFFRDGFLDRAESKKKRGRQNWGVLVSSFFIFKSFLAFMLYIIAGERVKIAY